MFVITYAVHMYVGLDTKLTLSCLHVLKTFSIRILQLGCKCNYVFSKLVTIYTRIPYSAKFWWGNILADLAHSPATAKNLPSKNSILNNKANSMTAQPPKYHHPTAFSSFIHQKLAPPKFCTIRYRHSSEQNAYAGINRNYYICTINRITYITVR